MRQVLSALVAAPLLLAVTGAPAYADTPPSSVSGVVFYDLNSDGVRQPDEPGAAGFKIGVRLVSDDVGISTYTDANGHYHVGDITAKGKFSVQIDRAGHDSTTPWAVGGTFNYGGVDAVVDFGIR
ncbi:MSCRAMM family adhesin SdrC [Saccharopolyspora gloriosae]|uniref:MSCRAMM family adhesin SdrC n=1 Tax=Saccharopolyspora gloriosae TaxID=455344 RepID=UPI001FB5BA75|nr:MSCRAMM family adhesin SdrC [Saccharopolyspora gloriosae]